MAFHDYGSLTSSWFSYVVMRQFSLDFAPTEAYGFCFPADACEPLATFDSRQFLYAE